MMLTFRTPTPPILRAGVETSSFMGRYARTFMMCVVSTETFESQLKGHKYNFYTHQQLKQKTI